MAGKKVNRIGRRYGRLVVVADAPNIGKVTRWLVRCDCGTEKLMRTNSLWEIRSCGCLNDEKRAERAYKHGLSRTKIYAIWVQMLERCNNKNNMNYKNYGARGIKVCPRWHKIENFFQDMGHKPRGQALDRIDNNGDYSPDNCRWATPIEQGSNKRRNKHLTFRGEKMTREEFSRRIGVKSNVILYQQKVMGLSPEEIAQRKVDRDRTTKS